MAATGFLFMCACGCFVLAAVIAALVYGVMHGLWLLVAAVLVLSCVLAWFGQKMTSARKRTQK
jgi:membrane protein implicated in regulation of membrane protease activity